MRGHESHGPYPHSREVGTRDRPYRLSLRRSTHHSFLEAVRAIDRSKHQGVRVGETLVLFLEIDIHPTPAAPAGPDHPHLKICQHPLRQILQLWGNRTGRKRPGCTTPLPPVGPGRRSRVRNATVRSQRNGTPSSYGRIVSSAGGLWATPSRRHGPRHQARPVTRRAS